MDAHNELMREWDLTIERTNYIIAVLDLGDNQRELDQELKYEIEERESA